MIPPQMIPKTQNSAINYKIVKCKNWEKDKTCKYGSHCTFAHGDEELRNKSDNVYPLNVPTFPMMVPMVYDPSMPMIFPGNPGMDFVQMQMMANQNPNMMGVMPNVAKPPEGNGDKTNDKNQQ